MARKYIVIFKFIFFFYICFIHLIPEQTQSRSMIYTGVGQWWYNTTCNLTPQPRKSVERHCFFFICLFVCLSVCLCAVLLEPLTSMRHFPPNNSCSLDILSLWGASSVSPRDGCASMKLPADQQQFVKLSDKLVLAPTAVQSFLPHSCKS